MKRRTYLGFAAAGAVGSIAGCSSANDAGEYPPYPNSETVELSGDGVGFSEAFELTLDGPTLVDVEHMGTGNLTVTLDSAAAVEQAENAESTTETSTDESAGANETDDVPMTNETDTMATNETGESTETNRTAESTETNRTDTDPVDGSEADDQDEQSTIAGSVISAAGRYDGRTHVSVEAGEYVLNVREADAEWTATMYDLPAYDDGVGVSAPIERSGDQYDVIGPINFGAQTETEFNFSVTGQGIHRVFLTNRHGDESFTVTNLRGDSEDTVSQAVGGVGYIEVLSFGSWTFELS